MPYTREAVAVRARDIRTGQSLPPGPPGSGVRPRAVSLSSWSWRVPALGAQLCAAVLSSPSASVASRHNVTRRGCVPSTRRGRGVLQCPSRGRSSPCGARQVPAQAEARTFPAHSGGRVRGETSPFLSFPCSFPRGFPRPTAPGREGQSPGRGPGGRAAALLRVRAASGPPDTRARGPHPECLPCSPGWA